MPLRGRMPGHEKRLHAALDLIQNPPRSFEDWGAATVKYNELLAQGYGTGAARIVMELWPQLPPAPYEWGAQDVLVTPLALISTQATLSPVATVDLTAGIAGAYDDEDGFLEYVDGRGWSTLADAAAELVGNERRLTYAQFGDLVFRPGGPGGVGALLVMLGTAAVTPRVAGRGFERVELRTLRTTPGVRAFHVPPAALTQAERCALCRAGYWSREQCKKMGCEGAAAA